MTGKDRVPWRTCLITVILTLCVLGLFCSCLLIEYNLQKTVYGHVDFGLRYRIEDGMPALTDTDGLPVGGLTDRQKTAVQLCLPAPLRLTGWLLRREGAAAARLADRLQSSAQTDGTADNSASDRF